MPTECENCKANPVDIAETTQGTTTVKLVAVLIAQGITDTKRLAEITGLKIRAVQAARNALQCAQQNAQAQQAAPKTHQNAQSAAECAQQAAPLAHATKESPTEISSSEVQLASARAGDDIAEAMISDIIGWMHGGDRKSAENWLANTTKTFGNDATRESYHKLKTDLLTGSVISRKLQAWSEMARRYKANPAPVKGSPVAAADVLPFKLSQPTHLKPKLEAANA